MEKPVFAPRDIFVQILEYSVIPTFDLIIELPSGGVVVAYRSIAPYQNKWALPGLRMYKNETIDDTLIRIAKQELGLEIDVTNRKLLGQYVGSFATEHNRQDLSTSYIVKAKSETIDFNKEHFTKFQVITRAKEIPTPIGAMYKFYLQKYFSM